MKLIYFHCHPDLYNDNFKMLNNGNKIVFMTNLPVLFERYYPKYKDFKNNFLALGYHPELIEEYPNYFEKIKRNLYKTRFVGEIGIDNSERNKESFEKQLRIFREIMDECNKSDGKIISIHSRKAESSIFEELINNNNIYSTLVHRNS